MENNIHLAKIKGKIDAKKLIVGKGVIVEENVTITGKDGPAESVVLGDYSYIGENTKILVPEFKIGDYSKLNANSFCHGINPLRIGRNCWFGGNIILDSIGGLDIDDNVGIGAHSQVWTHIKFGDIIQGSRFNSSKYMHIKKDVWLVGHTILSPVRVEERSMAMVGSVITKDMEYNKIYAGSPAKCISDKIGNQFEEIDVGEKLRRLNELISEFENSNPKYKNKLRAISHEHEQNDEYTWFNVDSRKYNKLNRIEEVLFLQEYTPIVKFTPLNEGSFIFRDLENTI